MHDSMNIEDCSCEECAARRESPDLPASVYRFDNNPKNHATFVTWCHMTTFANIQSAIAFVERAQTPTQKLKVVMVGKSKCNS
jgi:hypothetical protein